MSVESVEQIDGHDCLKIVSEAKSTRTVDRMYKVRDRIETWRDVEGQFSRRYTKRLREGKWKDDKRVEYNPEAGFSCLYRGEGAMPDTQSLDMQVQDVMSAFYEVRQHNLEVGRSVFFELHDIDKRYRLEVKVLRKETIEVPAGKFDCIVVEPLLQSSGIFRREGSVQIWLSDDQYKMPVLMQSRLYFGRVWAKLVGFRRGEP